MNKLTEAFRKADSNDIMTYSMVGVMGIMLIAVLSLPAIDRYVSQNSEISTPSHNLKLGR